MSDGGGSDQAIKGLAGLLCDDLDHSYSPLDQAVSLAQRAAAYYAASLAQITGSRASAAVIKAVVDALSKKNLNQPDHKNVEVETDRVVKDILTNEINRKTTTFAALKVAEDIAELKKTQGDEDKRVYRLQLENALNIMQEAGFTAQQVQILTAKLMPSIAKNEERLASR